MMDDKRVRDYREKSMTKVYNIKITTTEGPRTSGTFEFDGRTKSGQRGRFVHLPKNINFKVLSNRKGRIIPKEMKECSQKQDIEKALHKFITESEQSQNEPVKEFGVDTERELAAAHANSNAIIAKALQNDPELRAYVNTAIDKAQGRVPVEAALGKHHDDLLEIPDFLKRS
tara:strand:+ start:1016 stop:1531 length:516 start_codon:yes stop_codon:yes gene_type:complete